MFIGGVVVGPTLAYIATIISFGLGFVSSIGLTTYALATLSSGAVLGLLCAVVCALFRPKELTACYVTSAAMLVMLATKYTLHPPVLYMRSSLGTSIIGVWLVFLITFVTGELAYRLGERKQKTFTPRRA